MDGPAGRPDVPWMARTEAPAGCGEATGVLDDGQHVAAELQ